MDSWDYYHSVWEEGYWIYYHRNALGQIDSSTTYSEGKIVESVKFLKPPKDLSVSTLRSFDLTDRIEYQFARNNPSLPHLYSWKLTTDTLKIAHTYWMTAAGKKYLSRADTTWIDANHWLSRHSIVERDSIDNITNHWVDELLLDSTLRTYCLVKTRAGQFGPSRDTSFSAVFIGSIIHPNEIIIHAKYFSQSLEFKLSNIEWKDDGDDHTWMFFLDGSREPDYSLFFHGTRKIIKATRWSRNPYTHDWMLPEDFEVKYNEVGKPISITSPRLYSERTYFEDGSLRSEQTNQRPSNWYSSEMKREEIDSVLIETMYSMSSMHGNHPDLRLIYYYDKVEDH
jgi:hypothetical protein